MKKPMLYGLPALALALTLAACGDSAPPPKPAAKAAPPAPAPVAQPAAPKPEAQAPAPVAPDPNKELAARVKRALEDGSIQAAGIDVTAASGTVSLFGTVPNAGEKARAARIAGKVDGVKLVDNRLVVIRGS